MYTITTGMINAFEDCPAKYDLIYNHHVEIPSNDEFAEKGKLIHSLINYKLNNADISKMLTILDKPENFGLKTMWQNFLFLNIDKCEESEFTFYVPLNEQIRLTGRTDAIRKTEYGYEILDWKTGKSSNIVAETDWQTIVYLYGIFELFKFYKKLNSYDELSMTYCFLNENIQKTVKLTEHSYEIYKQKITEMSTKILNSVKTTAVNSAKCARCSYNIVCRRTYK